MRFVLTCLKDCRERDVRAAELAVNDARRRLQRAEESLVFLENARAQAGKHLGQMRRKVRELREVPKPDVSTWKQLLRLLK